MKYFYPIALLILVFGSQGCRVRHALKGPKLDKSQKVEKIPFGKLPLEVRDTLTNMFDLFQTTNAGDCQGNYYFEQFIVLDSAKKLHSIRHVNESLQDIKTFERLGVQFSLSKKKFLIPFGSGIVMTTIYDNRLYMMGNYVGNIEKVWKCDHPDHWKIDYEGYLFWVMKL